ncbi:MAG: DpnD/PcfM family protein, partial [Clostridiales bacterium]|nr:DpnD/PcfM family protein [Clostridiales bacterium]
MKEFEVTITETLQKSVVVEADSKDDAIQMVEDMWKDADIILDSENFVGVEYESDNGIEIE